MNIFLEKALDTVKNKKFVVTAVLVFVIVQIIFGMALIGITLAYDKIYKGVYINDIYVSGLNREEAEELVRKTYESRIENMQITVKYQDMEEEIKPTEFITSLNYKNAVNEAYDEGRNGNLISRIYNISKLSSKGKVIELDYNFNEGKLQQLVGKYYLKMKKDMVETTYQIYEDKIVVNVGRHGESLDEEALRLKLAEKITGLQAGAVEIPVKITNPEPLDISQLHKKVYAEPKDASYQVKNYKLDIVPEVIGRDFDVEKATELLKTQKEGSSFEIPLKLTYPKVYTKQIQESLFKDEISAFSTKYNQGDKERSENIRLAAQSINGVVLAPGDVFSYNEVVGERTAVRGYKEAHVYVNGQITDGIGGGICQVSTTLYNAVLFADLEVVSRRNHNMTVSYVPAGRDATVAYGSIDFKFKNNFKAPIKIVITSGGGKLSVQILGVNENPSKKIELVTETLESYPYKEIVTEDPTKPVGYYKVLQNGMKGYKVNTYKVTKIDGKTISKKLITTSKYIPSNKRVVKGTKPVASSQTSTPINTSSSSAASPVINLDTNQQVPIND